MVLREYAANPYRRGHLVFGAGNPLADQIPRFANPRRGVDVDARVAEKPRRKNRQRDKRPLRPMQRHTVRGQGHLRQVEFAKPRHAEKGLLDRQIKVVEVDAVDFDRAVLQGAGAIVVPAGEAQLQTRHRDDPSVCAGRMIASWPRSRFRAQARCRAVRVPTRSAQGRFPGSIGPRRRRAAPARRW